MKTTLIEGIRHQDAIYPLPPWKQEHGVHERPSRAARKHQEGEASPPTSSPSGTELPFSPPSPPRPARRRRSSTEKQQIERQQALFAKILEGVSTTAHSGHRSRKALEPYLELPEIWPEELEALLQTTGIYPRTRILSLISTPAPLPRHLRPAKPPEKARERPGLSVGAVNEGERRERGRGSPCFLIISISPPAL
jgi:hypothetical protein